MTAMAGAHVLSSTTINSRPVTSQMRQSIHLMPSSSNLCNKRRRVFHPEAFSQTATIEISSSTVESALNLENRTPALHHEQHQSLAWQQRTRLLLGDEKALRLHHARVLVVGLGGVGSFAAEFLARAGVGSLTIIDGDTVDISNCNRQLPAMSSTVGMLKVQVMQDRLRSIAPSAIITGKQEFLLPETAVTVLAAGCLGQDGQHAPFDWVVDAIDSLEPKKLLIASAQSLGIPVISAMGAGGRLDASRVRVVPLSTTYNDPFAMNIRKGLRRKGVDISKVPCVWSDEPVNPSSLQLTTGSKFKRSYHGTISFLPAEFGLLAAAHVINAITDGPMARAYQKLHKQQAKKRIVGRPAGKTALALDVSQQHTQPEAVTTDTATGTNNSDLPPVFFSFEMLQQCQAPTSLSIHSKHNPQAHTYTHNADISQPTSPGMSVADQQCIDTVALPTHSDLQHWSNIDDHQMPTASTGSVTDTVHTLCIENTHVMPSYMAALHSYTSYSNQGWGI